MTVPIPDAGVSAVTDHAFKPRKESWGLCRCGLSEAAHATTLEPYAPDMTQPYRCPLCVEAVTGCRHR